MLCSPALYSGQEVTARVSAPETDNPTFEFFIVYFNEDDQLKTLYDTPAALIKGENVRTWTIPGVGGHAIYRLGIRLKSEKRLEGSIVLKSLDWSNVPVFYRMGGAMEMTPSLTPWTTTTAWMKTFVSSADNFCPDYTTTFSISHGAENGVVTTGTLDWDNYCVKSRITFSQQDGAGLVARAKGHRRYYGAVLTKGKAVIYRQDHTKRAVISSADYEYQIDNTYELQFIVESGNLTLYVDGKPAVSGTDSHYHSGGAGFVVDSGAILGDGFEVKRIGGKQV